MKSFDKTTCWHSQSPVVYQNMIDGAKGKLFPRLEDSDHYHILKEFLQKASDKGVYSLIDVGCGAAEISRVFGGFHYTGVDLQHIVENVSMAMNPTNSYLCLDLYKDELDVLEDYDFVLLNAIIDVVEDPFYCLRRILNNSSRSIVVHRQTVTPGKNQILKNESYGGTTFKTILNEPELKKAFIDHGFFLKKEMVLYSNGRHKTKSFLLEKI